MKVTILGSGSSGGVPRIGNHWGACDPNEPKNRRRRCSMLVQQFSASGDVTSVLVDTSPDMRDQLNDADCGKLDAVLFTHSHADQCHGVDDLRMVAMNMRQRVECHADPFTADVLSTRFDYCFKQAESSPYPAILNLHADLEPGKPVVTKGPGGLIEAIPFLQLHGHIDSLGFRFGPVAYSSDVVDIPDESFEILEGVDCWIVDCLRYTPHPTHAHLDMALEWIDRVKPRHAVLTNLHVDLDYNELKAKLPAGIEPAYDGMEIDFKNDDS